MKNFSLYSEKLKEIMNGIAVIVANQADIKEELSSLASRVQRLEHKKSAAIVHEMSDNEDSCNESLLEDETYEDQEEGEYNDREQEVEMPDLSMDHFLSPSHTQQGEDSMDELLQDYEEEKETSAQVNSKLAEFIDSRFRNGISEETYKKLTTEDKPLRPENCKNLTNIKVNVPVWNAMPAKAKKLDFKLQEIQRTNINGGIWLTQAIDEMLQLQKQLKGEGKPVKLDNIVKKCNLTVNMLAQSYHKTNLFRRHIIKTELAPKYRDICAVVPP